MISPAWTRHAPWLTPPIGYKERQRRLTEDGLPAVFQVNTLAPYVLTAVMHRPRRLVYVSSELHRRGQQNLDDLTWEHRAWNGTKAYSDTKFHDVLLAFAFARLWPKVLSNAMEPGWGSNEDGWPERHRKSRPGAPHAGMARSQ